MKTNSWLVLTMTVLCFLSANAQVSLPSVTTGPVVVESGPHHRVWQTVTIDATGQTNVSSYTELATGLNVWNPATGKYEPSKEQFQIVADGSAIATNGQHQVILAADINSGGSVDLLMPDGQRLLSNPMGLSFFDTASGKNVLIAEVTNCVGQLMSPNVVVYPNAFDTLKASLRYTYTKSGFSQDVLLHENPGSPADYGLNPESTLLEMYSEFHNPPERRKTIQPMRDGTPDETLDFPQMQIGRGVAYVLNDTLEPAIISKTWTRIEGRDFLIESVPYTAIKPLLEQLHANAGSVKTNHTAKVSFPERRKMVAQALKSRAKLKQVASIKPGRMDRQSAAVIDYQTLNTSQTNYLFKGDSTYFITDAVNLAGTVTFEGGSVIKYDTNLTSSLWVLDQVNCLATAYRPVVLTAKDDDTVGEGIGGSTGIPAPASCGNYGIVVTTGTSASTTLSHLRFGYLRTAFLISRQAVHSLSHAQIVNCGRAILVYASSDVSARNVLIDQATTAFDHGSGTARGEHLTVHRTTNLKA